MSNNEPQREMTLKEWMARLPATHTANVELAALERELAEAEAERDDLRRQRDQWKEFAYKHPEVTPPVVMQELATLRADLATAAGDLEDAFRMGFRSSEYMNDVDVDINAEGKAVAKWIEERDVEA